MLAEKHRVSSDTGFYDVGGVESLLESQLLGQPFILSGLTVVLLGQPIRLEGGERDTLCPPESADQFPVIGILVHQHPLDDLFSEIIDRGSLQAYQCVCDNDPLAGAVTDRHVVGQPADSEPRVALVEPVLKKRLRRAPVSHRGVVGEDRRCIRRGIKHYTCNDVGGEGPLPAILSDRAQRWEKQKRREDRDQARAYHVARLFNFCAKRASRQSGEYVCSDRHKKSSSATAGTSATVGTRTRQRHVDSVLIKKGPDAGAARLK